MSIDVIEITTKAIYFFFYSEKQKCAQNKYGKFLCIHGNNKKYCKILATGEIHEYTECRHGNDTPSTRFDDFISLGEGTFL